MMQRQTSWILTTLVMLAGCGFDRSDHPAQTCQTAEDCEAGQECSSGFCIGSQGGSGGSGGSGGVCTGTGTEPCYDGASGTEDQGVCRRGERLCVNGQWTQCLGQVTDSDEQCNGRDDDCDGEIDNLGQLDCDTTMLGECATGQYRCTGSQAVCDQINVRVEEICDTRDNDCDGKTDEDTSSICFPATEGCVLSDGAYQCVGVCASGTRACGADVNDCPGAIVPADEACTDSNGGGSPIDEDCDGQVDEGCACTGDVSRACYGGTDGTQGVGACRAGTQQCDGSVWGDCDGDVGPTLETCSNPGVDNDCDRVLDDVLGAGAFCVDLLKQGVCRTGTRGCESDRLRCITPTATAEVCDNAQKDEDCDGQVNEGFALATDESNCGSCGNVCGDGQTCCAGQCVDLNSDPAACGSCDNDCGTSSCCSGHCADTMTATTNCGGCGVTCDSDEACCGSCTNTDVDTNNCGACGRACDSNQFCCAGGCQDSSCSCSQCAVDGGTCCDESCTDTATDESNCGGCGLSCGSGQQCLDGVCCAGGTINCDGSCVVATTDELNCGGCGLACNQGQQCCGGACVDPATSASNCGGCGQLCASPSSCSDGVCCGAGTTTCGNACVDTLNSEQHCGGCGQACDQGETCCSGQCRDLYGDNGSCGSCGAGCGLGEQCCQGECLRTGTSSGFECACSQDCGDLACCGKSCVDILNDSANCGGCGISCGFGGPLERTCCNGQCTTGFCIDPI